MLANRKITIGSAILALGAIVCFASFLIPLGHYGGSGARAFPIMSAVALMILGGLQIRSDLAETRSDIPPSPSKTQYAPFVLLGLVLGYLWLISKVGYLISTAFVTPAILLLFGVRKPVGLLVAAFVVPATYHIIFFELLGVFPPYGEWFDLLDLIEG